jgi:tetrapyrrole methylase family protein / MazG family protein
VSTPPDPLLDHPAREREAEAFSRLSAIIRRLRAPGGCPWDREQTPATLRGSLVEEAWEAVSAIETHDDTNLREELGDLYLVVTMIAAIREESGAFAVADSLDEVSEKLIRRHPHVFGTATAGTSHEVLQQWDRIKAQEHAARAAGAPVQPLLPGSVLDKVPRSIPPLERAARLQRRAAKTGFDWPSAQPVWEKVQEELAELRAEVDAQTTELIEDEAGDVLFSVVNLLRLLHVDPGLALQRANSKFERRFRAMESRIAARGGSMDALPLEAMDAVWDEVKAEEIGSREPAGPARKEHPGAPGAAGNQAGSGGAHSASK